MTTGSVAVLLVLLAVGPLPANGATQLKSSPRVLQPPLQQQADLVVRCVSQKALPGGLTAAERTALSRVAADLRAGQVATAKTRWQGLITGMTVSNRSLDPTDLVQWVLRESYLEQAGDLRFYADKVRFFNEAKESIRTHLDRAKTLRARSAAGAAVPVQVVQLRPYSKDVSPVGAASKRRMTKGELEDYISKMEEKLNTVGDDAQLANVDLQNVLQKQQQLLQTLSNIMKMLNDTAMSIVRNLK